MKRASRISKKGTRKARRSKKLTRRINRRRQRGGGEVVLNCTIGSGSISVVVPPMPSGASPITTSSSSRTALTITTATPIKNIQLANAPAAKVGSDTAIKLQDMTDNKYVIPQTSYLYTRSLTPAQKKLDEATGSAFPSGLKIINLNAANLGLTSSTTTFNITITI